MKNSFTGSVSKIKLSKDDFVLVGMNYNYYMIPKLAHSRENLEELKQEILKNQEMSEELKAVWDGTDHMFVNNIAKIMERYFGTRR